MKQSEQTKNNTANEQTVDIEQLEKEAGYPDISKANTKTVVILSLVSILILLLLSIFVPTPEQDNTTSEQTSTEATSEATKNQTSEETQPGLFDMGTNDTTSVIAEVFSIPSLPEAEPGFLTINNHTYYLLDDEQRFLTGWLNLNGICYYFNEDGVMITGWYETQNQLFYFDETGAMQTNQWIEDKYVGENGAVLTNAVTPDGIYVGKDGYANDSVGKQGSKAGLTDLKSKLETMISGYSGSWSIYVKDLENNEYLSINNVQYFSASLIKLYCAATAYELMENGTLEETERIDSLMSQMISVSDNDAFNLMVMACDEGNSHVAGRAVIQDYIDQEGYKDTTITSMLVPTKYKAPSSPGRNLTTVEDCGLLLEKIYKGKCVSPEASQEFLELLLNQTHTNKIPAGLPEGTKSANNTGYTDQFQHDAAIVYSPGGDYIITIMSSNCGAAIPNIQEISKIVYEYFVTVQSQGISSET